MPFEPPTPEVKEKAKHGTDLKFRVPLTVEACSEKLEALADDDAQMEVTVELLPKNGVWPVTVLYGDSNPLKPTFTRTRFTGALQRTDDDGAILTGHVALDVSTFVTRGVYLALFGPFLMMIFVRFGFRYPVVGFVCMAILVALLYLLAIHPNIVLKQHEEHIIDRITHALRP